MKIQSNMVAVIDDNEQIRSSICEIIKSVNLPSIGYANAIEYLSDNVERHVGCIICDIRLPYKSGLEFFEELKSDNIDIPIIFITGYADIKIVVHAMKSGAIDVLEKPFAEQELLDAVNYGLKQGVKKMELKGKQEKVRQRAEYLTQREFEVFKLLVEGKLNKVIAADMQLSTRTVEKYRSNVMHKMSVKSLPELVYCAEQLKSEEYLSN